MENENAEGNNGDQTSEGNESTGAPNLANISGAQLDEALLRLMADQEIQPKKKREPLSKKSKRLIAFITAGALLASGITLAVIPWSDLGYTRELKALGLSKQFTNERVAISQGKAYCETLKNGATNTGFKTQKVAVRYYCSEFLEGFKIKPTPEEQQAILVRVLRKEGLAGTFASEAEAVAKAQAVCEKLNAGGANKGVLANFIAVKLYCPTFAAGFTVLREIKVTGTFTIYNDGYYFPTIGANNGKCWGANGYNDIHSGTRVVVKNLANKELTETTLDGGKGSWSKCVFKFHFTVLEGETKYKLAVGHRGTITYTENEFKEPGRVHLFL